MDVGTLTNNWANYFWTTVKNFIQWKANLEMNPELMWKVCSWDNKKQRISKLLIIFQNESQNLWLNRGQIPKPLSNTKILPGILFQQALQNFITCIKKMYSRYTLQHGLTFLVCTKENVSYSGRQTMWLKDCIF